MSNGNESGGRREAAHRARGVMRQAVLGAVLFCALNIGAATQADDGVSTNSPVAGLARCSPADPFRIQLAVQALRERQERVSRKAIRYLWDERMDPQTGRIGAVQTRYLQALCYLALVADGSDSNPRYIARLEKVIASLREPLAPLEGSSETGAKLFLGTSRESLSFETHAVIALACEQLAASDLGDPSLNELFFRGAESAIAYIMDYRKRGRNYESAGGWPINAAPYNQSRPDRRCTAWQLLLLKTHSYLGGRVDSTAMEEAPGFVLAAQRLPPERTPSVEEAEKTSREWMPRIRRGESAPEPVRDMLNEYWEYKRRMEEVGGFGIDTLGITSPGATAVGLFVQGLFDADEDRRHLAAQAFARMPLAWDSQRFFLNQFFAARGLWMYSQRFKTMDFANYMNRLLTLMEQKQDEDGSFPMGSMGVEELNLMERVYTTAMCVLIVNANRGNLVFDRIAH